MYLSLSVLLSLQISALGLTQSSLNMLRLHGREASSSLVSCLVAGSKPCCPSCCCLEELMEKSVRMRSLDINQMETEHGRWSLHLNLSLSPSCYSPGLSILGELLHSQRRPRPKTQPIPKILNGVKVWTLLWPIHVWKCCLMLPEPLFHNLRPDDSWHCHLGTYLCHQGRTNPLTETLDHSI